MRSLSRLLALSVLLSLPACTHYPGGITASTTHISANGYDVLGPTEASDCVVRLLGLIPVTSANRLRRAMGEAIQNVPGANAMINVTVEFYSQYWILWSNACTEVQGLAIRTK